MTIEAQSTSTHQLAIYRGLYQAERRARVAAEAEAAEASKLRAELFALRQRVATLEAKLERAGGGVVSDEQPHSFEHSLRVEVALERCGRNESDLAEQWRECAVRWGSVSPAALGCLLALVRRAWDCEVDIRVGARVEVAVGFAVFTRRTLAEALVAALEDAPREATS